MVRQTREHLQTAYVVSGACVSALYPRAYPGVPGDHHILLQSLFMMLPFSAHSTIKSSSGENLSRWFIQQVPVSTTNQEQPKAAHRSASCTHATHMYMFPMGTLAGEAVPQLQVGKWKSSSTSEARRFTHNNRRASREHRPVIGPRARLVWWVGQSLTCDLFDLGYVVVHERKLQCSGGVCACIVCVCVCVCVCACVCVLVSLALWSCTARR